MNRVSAPGAPPTDRLQIDHLQVLLQSRSIIACYKCISKLARSRPPSASPNSLDHGLQVQLSVHSITASKCISKLARSRHPSAALSSLDLGLQVHLQTPWIMASKCSSQFTRSWPPSASPNSLDHGLQVQLSVHSISEFNRPVRPQTTQDGTGRCHAVRPKVGRKRCRLFEAGRGRTERTAGDGEEPSPVVIHQYPWILVYITKLICKTE